MHSLNDPSFFFTNSTGAPQGEKLGLMNPLSNRSCNCAFSSFNSAGAIRYGAMDMGFIPGMSSMLNFTFLSSGKPDNSPENTSTNFFTTGIY